MVQFTYVLNGLLIACGPATVTERTTFSLMQFILNIQDNSDGYNVDAKWMLVQSAKKNTNT